MNEPKEITAGFKYSWTESLSSYPANDGWTLKYILINSANKKEFSSTANGADHLVDLTPDVTAVLPPGDYLLTSYVENIDGRKYKITSFNFKILFDPIDGAAQETRSFEKRMLDAIQALEEGRATTEQESFTIAGRSITYLSPEELIKWKSYYKRIVYAQDGKVVTKNRLAKFINPS